MTPQGKKALIVISTFVIVGGAIGFYFWNKKKKEKEAGGNTSADPALDQNNVTPESVPNVAPPSGVAPLPDAPAPKPKVKSASGYYLNQPMYLVSGREATSALNYPAISQKNTVGVIKRRADSPAAFFLSDAGAKGYAKVSAVVNGVDGNITKKTVYILTGHFTSKKP